MTCYKNAILLTCFAVMLSGCTNGPRPVKIETVEVVREVMRPCPVDVPERPAYVHGDTLPADARDALRIVSIALAMWQAVGGYGDQAGDAIKVCTAP
jgi:hypothetical protein